MTSSNTFVTASLLIYFDSINAAVALLRNVIARWWRRPEGRREDSELGRAIRVSLQEEKNGKDLFRFVEELADIDSASGAWVQPDREPAIAGFNYKTFDRLLADLTDLQTLQEVAEESAGSYPLVVIAESVDPQRLRGVWRAMTDQEESVDWRENRAVTSGDGQSEASEPKKKDARTARGTRVGAGMVWVAAGVGVAVLVIGLILYRQCWRD
jgi:hypothetical protein